MRVPTWANMPVDPVNLASSVARSDCIPVHPMTPNPSSSMGNVFTSRNYPMNPASRVRCRDIFSSFCRIRYARTSVQCHCLQPDRFPPLPDARRLRSFICPPDVRQQRGYFDETAHAAGQFQKTRYERVGPFRRLRRSRNIFIGPQVTDFRNLVD